MRGGFLFGSLIVLSFAAACGGSGSPSVTPTSAPPASHPDEEPPVPVSHDADSPPSSDAEQPADAGPKKPDVPTPAFKENGSVADAIAAVPQGTPRLNIEQEALGRPLGNVELYEPCKPGNAHFKAKVAVWDGKAVGLDLTTTPKNQKLSDCIAEKIRSVTWQDKVKSLNIVEYMF